MKFMFQCLLFFNISIWRLIWAWEWHIVAFQLVVRNIINSYKIDLYLYPIWLDLQSQMDVNIKNNIHAPPHLNSFSPLCHLCYQVWQHIFVHGSYSQHSSITPHRIQTMGSWWNSKSRAEGELFTHKWWWLRFAFRLRSISFLGEAEQYDFLDDTLWSNFLKMGCPQFLCNTKTTISEDDLFHRGHAGCIQGFFKNIPKDKRVLSSKLSQVRPCLSLRPTKSPSPWPPNMAWINFHWSVLFIQPKIINPYKCSSDLPDCWFRGSWG